MLTGLYPQQTCLFVLEDNGGPALLPYNKNWTASNGQQPGYPTIGNVLSQSLPNFNFETTVYTSYDCAWIGKWHLSDGTPAEDAESVAAYGFTNKYSIPNPPSDDNPYTPFVYPSPDGSVDEANGGSFLDGTLAQSLSGYDSPTFPAGSPAITPLSYPQLNDAAIYQAFKAYWLANPPAEPWFCAVSFINAHDISRFPWAYGLAGSTGLSGAFPNIPSDPDQLGYLPPTTAGLTVSCTPLPCDGTTIPGQTAVFSTSSTPPAGNWNTDDPSLQPYLNCDGLPAGKPGLQAFFQSDFNSTCGEIQGASGWAQFLNYYYWMQGCVDGLVGNVWDDITNAQTAGTFTHPIMFVFTSDHGDFGGSHNLHSKGGALYDECSNVPFYVTFVGNSLAAPIVQPFACSSVDLLPFLYSVALGNEEWRCPGANDMIGYLAGRESIRDAIYSSSPANRRLSSLPNSTGGGYQPYILHSEDQYNSATFSARTCSMENPSNQPSHGIGFRTVDLTSQPSPRSGQQSPLPYAAGTEYGPYGGGKLGMYSYWNTAGCSTWPILGDSDLPMQFEFYNYNTGNFAEIGNDAFDAGEWDATALDYVCAYNTVYTELYNTNFPTGFTTPSGASLQDQLQAAYQLAFQTYIDYVTGCVESCPTCTAPVGQFPCCISVPGHSCGSCSTPGCSG
jgi:hypothetical protein